ncbi:MAG: DUF1282 domain-containing protein [Phenylobacterium sp.]|nr:MAG: DUF1282 domain-containing protein [Phenylobacterium sp.]
MSAAEPSSRRGGLLWRPAGMLLRPGRTLDAVADQHADSIALYVGYILPLAAIGPVCGVIGLLVFGASIAGIHLKPSIGATLIGGVIDYLLSLVSAYLLALVVAGLAPLFGARGGRLQALKLVAYAGTALWLAGLFAVYPTLGFPMAVLGGLYSLYALFLGLEKVMHAAPDKVLTYFACVLIAVVALAIALRLATGLIR